MVLFRNSLYSFILRLLIYDRERSRIISRKTEQKLKGVDRNERKVLPIYAGKIWKRPVEPLFDDFGDCMFWAVIIWWKIVLWAGGSHPCLFIFQNVFQKYL